MDSWDLRQKENERNVQWTLHLKSRVEWNLDNYRPQPSCGKVMFSQASVILITGKCVWQTPPGQTPLWADTPPFPMHAGIHTPLPSACLDTPPGGATAPDGTHPTGMHSCWSLETKEIGTFLSINDHGASFTLHDSSAEHVRRVNGLNAQPAVL